MSVPDYSAGLGGSGEYGLDAGGRQQLPFLPACTDVNVQVVDADVFSTLQSGHNPDPSRRAGLSLEVRVISVNKDSFAPCDFKKGVGAVASQQEAETREGFAWPGIAELGQTYKLLFWRNTADITSVQVPGKTYEPEMEASGQVKDPWVKTCFPFLSAVVKAGLNPRADWENPKQMENAVKFAGFPLLTRYSIPEEAQNGYQYDEAGFVLIPVPGANGRITTYRQPDSQAAKAYWRGQVFGVRDVITTTKAGRCFQLHNFYYVNANQEHIHKACEELTGMEPRNFSNAIFFGGE